MKIKFEWDKSFDDKILKAINKGVEAGTIEVERRAKANCPVVTGDLRSSITREVIGTTGKVYTDKIYAGAVEFGVKPHNKIKVKNAKVLTDGKNFFGKKVHYPGFKGRFFMRRALYENWAKIQNLINRVFKASLG